MGVGSPCPHFGGNPDRLHDFLGSSSFLQGGLCMPSDAIRTLSYVRNCHSDKLLGFRGERPFGEYALTKGLERLCSFWRQSLSLLSKFFSCCWVNPLLLGHDLRLLP